MNTRSVKWLCSQRNPPNNCKAYVLQKIGENIDIYEQVDFNLKKPHTHNAIIGAGVKKRVMAEIKKKVKDNTDRATGQICREIYRENIIYNKVPASMMPKIAYARRNGNAARQSMRPKPPALGDKGFVPQVYFFQPNFFRARTEVDINGEMCCSYIFASQFQADQLIQMATLNWDGTFSSCKDPILQLYSMDGFATNDQGINKNKSNSNYVQILTYVIHFRRMQNSTTLLHTDDQEA